MEFTYAIAKWAPLKHYTFVLYIIYYVSIDPQNFLLHLLVAKNLLRKKRDEDITRNFKFPWQYSIISTHLMSADENIFG